MCELEHSMRSDMKFKKRADYNIILGSNFFRFGELDANWLGGSFFYESFTDNDHRYVTAEFHQLLLL
jgi:hypothetical protein